MYDKVQSEAKTRMARKVLFLNSFILTTFTSEEAFGHLGGVLFFNKLYCFHGP